ncbi:uncharacterized protein LOC144103890 [Amblyomma americanum]
MQPPAKKPRSDAVLRKREAAVLHCTSVVRASTSCLPRDVIAVSPLPTASSPVFDSSNMDVASGDDRLHVKPCCTTKEEATQVDVRISISVVERQKWRRKERDMKTQIEQLKRTVDRYKEELRRVREECNIAAFTGVVKAASEQHMGASILVDQIKNFGKTRPSWSELVVRHCIILRNLSTRAYEHIRKEGILKLPSRSTLQRFLGVNSGEVGFTSLVKERLQVEASNLKAEQAKVCSLVVDEMRIQQRLQYNKQRDAFVGEVDLGNSVQKRATGEPVLANSLLCFVLTGLSVHVRIPVGYFLTRNCTGQELFPLIKHVIKEVEDIGFKILRIVSDNHKINVLAFQLLCGGSLSHCTQHPEDPTRKLFLAFDQCHIIKNVRSQFLARDLGKDGEVSSSHLKELYRMQQDSIVKPVRFLTRKHVFPSNIEKMNVSRAVQVFSPPVTAALKLLQEQAGHTCDMSFAAVGPTIKFMDIMHRWFLLMDVSNCAQHIQQKLPDSRQYDSSGDSRLSWLMTSFQSYLQNMQRHCQAKQFLSKETYQALVMTTISNVECIKHLLAVESFKFVLTRKFSSDPIESFFGWLRRSAGSNDQTDARAVLSGVEKVLKTGLVSASLNSNVVDTSNHSLGPLSTKPAVTQHVDLFPQETRRLLGDLLKNPKSLLPTPDTAALSMLGGYLARVVQEKLDCSSCTAFLTRPASSAPSDSLIHQDRGGLFYPSTEFVYVLYALRKYIEVMLEKRRFMEKPLQAAVSTAVDVLAEYGALKCARPCSDHNKELLKLVCTKFFRPVFTNYALSVTDRRDIFKPLTSKPVSRKLLKL